MSIETQPLEELRILTPRDLLGRIQNTLEEHYGVDYFDLPSPIMRSSEIGVNGSRIGVNFQRVEYPGRDTTFLRLGLHGNMLEITVSEGEPHAVSLRKRVLGKITELSGSDAILGGEKILAVLNAATPDSKDYGVQPSKV